MIRHGRPAGLAAGHVYPPGAFPGVFFACDKTRQLPLFSLPERQDRRLIISPARIAMGSAAMRKEGGFPPECLSHP